MLVLVSGGSGSGKSEYAEEVSMKYFRDRKNKDGELLYVATMVSFDEETDRRIERHRKLRDGKGFRTIECPTHLEQVKGRGGDVILLECMSNLLANEMYARDGQLRQGDLGAEEEADVILETIDRLVRQTEAVVIVTNEIFSDGKTYDPSTELYRKRLGYLNRKLAERAKTVVEVVCAIPVCVKGENPC